MNTEHFLLFDFALLPARIFGALARRVSGILSIEIENGLQRNWKKT